MLIGVLGPVRVSDLGGVDVALGGRLERRVLSALAAAGGAPAEFEALVDAVFQGAAVDGAVLRLQNHVSRLRRRLGRAIIARDGSSYRLDLGQVEVDWLDFDQLVLRSRTTTEPTAAAELLTDALALWRGEFLPELADWDSVVALRARLSESRRAVADALALATLVAGDATRATAMLEGLVAEEPLRERRWGLLMLALHRDARTAEALRVHGRARVALAEAGVVPGRELRTIDSAIATDDSDAVDSMIGHLAATDLTVPLTVRAGKPPEPLGSWVGPVDTVHEVAEAIRSSPVTSLVGPGGIGKTRLALEAAQSLQDNGLAVIFADLTPVRSPESVIAALASTVGVAPQPGTSLIGSVLEWFRRRTIVVVLDNCEHVVEAVASLLGALHGAVPTVSVLVTSRRPIGVSWERAITVDPPAIDDCVELFVRRAHAADSSAAIHDPDRSAVREICERLDHLPLAIELAARRIRSNSPDQLLRRLDDRLDLLHGRSPETLGRHASLRACFDWSFALLIADDQEVFAHLWVFAGSFRADAVTAVVGELLPTIEPLEALDRLVEHSLVAVERSDHVVRFRLHESLRQYSMQLPSTTEPSVLRRRYVRDVVTFAESTSRRWSGAWQIEASHAFDQEWDAIRAAHDMAIESNDLEATERLIHAVDGYAQQTMRAEVGDWALVTLEHQRELGTASAELCGRVAHWRVYAGDIGAARALVTVAVECVDDPDGPRTALCRAFDVVAMLASGMLDDLAPATELLARTTAAASDPFVRGWGWGALCLSSPLVDPSSHRRWVDELASDASRLGSAYLRLSTLYYRTMQELFIDDSPAYAAAAERAALGTLAARQIGDRHFAAQFELQQAFAALMSGEVPTLHVLAATIDELLDTRNWLMMGVGLECAATTLLRLGHVEAGVTIEEYLRSNRRLWGGFPTWSAMRDAVLETATVHDPIATARIEAPAPTCDATQIAQLAIDSLRAACSDC